jgi:hypothetical protein
MTEGCRKFRHEELRNLPPSFSMVMINKLRELFRPRWVKVRNVEYYSEKTGDLEAILR